MGRFIPDEQPQFSFLNNMVQFQLEGCLKFKYEAIRTACARHSVPSAIEAQGNAYIDPWDRVKVISDACVKAGFSVSLNCTTMHEHFYWKVYPVIFEMVCCEFWPNIQPNVWNASNPSDAKMFDAMTQAWWNIDFKCKHRNKPPRDNHNVSIPMANTGTTTDIYCFGQMEQAYEKDPNASSLHNGYILGICGKKVFIDSILGAQMNKKGQEDSNGVKYRNDAYCKTIGELWRWKSMEEARGFYNHPYRVAVSCSNI